MAKVVKTIRIDPDLWARVAQRVTDEGGNTNALVVRFITEGLAERITAPTPEPKAVSQKAETKAAHLATPAPSPNRSRWNINLQVGPTTPPPGSRLKQPKRPR